MQGRSEFVVRGRVLSQPDRKPVYGLEVQVYDKDHLFDDQLGVTYTDENGVYALRYDESDFRDLFEGSPDLYVEIRDCNNTILYSSADAVLWEAGREATIDVAIAAERLAPHLQKLRPLARLHGGLVARDKLAVIDSAAALLETRIAAGEVPPLDAGGLPAPRPGQRVPLSAAYCPAPDILLFDDLLDLAWSVIANDKLAIPRYREVLGTLIYRGKVRQAEAVAAAAARWTRQPPDDTRTSQALLDSRRKMLGEAPDDTLVETDRLLPVLAAAVIAAGGDTTIENTYVSFLLGQCNALGQLDRVYRAARGALTSNPGGLGSFGNLLRHVGGTCGPDDGPVPWPWEPDDWREVDEIWRLEKWQCTAEMSNAVRRGMLNAGSYEITGVDWSDGCPGSPIVIRGTNFSGIFPDSNRVLFAHRSGWGTVEAAAEPGDWTDTRIEVVLPDEAGPGPVSLSIVGSFATACGRGIHVPRHGNVLEFSGGAAYIRVFTADDRRGEFGVAPGETVTLRWLVVPPDSAVELHVEQDGVVWPVEIVGAEGSRDVAIPAGRASLTVCTLHSANACPGSDSRVITLHGGLAPVLEVVGMEVTQAIQHYGAAEHLDDRTDQGPDNSVRLVVGKPAMVRVYARSGLPAGYEGGRIERVTGTLDVERIEAGVGTPLTSLSALPITVEAAPDYADERGDLRATLNFFIPANLMSGRLGLRATVNTPGGWYRMTTDFETTVDVDLEQTLQLAGIMIGYNGPPVLGAPGGTPNLVVASPGLADLQTTAGYMLATYPVRSDSWGTFRIAATFVQTVPLQDPLHSPGCSVNWDALMADLREIVTDDAAAVPGNWLYYGLLANGVPIGTPPGGAVAPSGCGGSGVGSGSVGDGLAMAHEIGHALGLQHAPHGAPTYPANVDPHYPTYEHTPADYPDASIGEYGFGALGGLNTLYDPATTFDFMAYPPGPFWISLYHYEILARGDLTSLSPTVVPAGLVGGGAFVHAQDNTPQPLISFISLVTADGDVDDVRVTRLVTRPQVTGGTATDMWIELLDGHGAVLSSGMLFRLPSQSAAQSGTLPGCGKALHQGFLSNVARGAALQLRRGDEVLWRRDAPQTEVAIKSVHVTLDTARRLNVAWDADVDPACHARAALRWSNDGGKRWHSLTVGLTDNPAEIDLAHVPGGPTTFEVMVHDGFDTARLTSVMLDLPHLPPTAAMLSPPPDTTVVAGGALRLWGAALDERGLRIPDDHCTWTLDGQVIATGTDVIIKAPAVGEHRLVFEATDKHGTTRDERTFIADGAS